MPDDNTDFIPQHKLWWKFLRDKMLVIIPILLLLGATGAAGYFYKQLTDLRNDPNQAALDESRNTIDAVGKLILLPTDEQPTLATVTDPEKLKDQPFFASAQKDDKVLIYTNAKKAILYRPSTNKIVEVAPINIGENDASVSGSTTDTGVTQTPKK